MIAVKSWRRGSTVFVRDDATGRCLELHADNVHEAKSFGLYLVRAKEESESLDFDFATVDDVVRYVAERVEAARWFRARTRRQLQFGRRRT